MQLTGDDYAAILDVLGSVASAEDVTDYARRVSAGLHTLLPSTAATCAEIDSSGRRVISESTPAIPQSWLVRYGPLFEEWGWQHPHFSAFAGPHRLGPLVWRATDPGIAETELYRRFYGPNGIDSQIVLVFPGATGTAIAMSADGALDAFGDREVTMLTLIAPMLENGHRLVSRSALPMLARPRLSGPGEAPVDGAKASVASSLGPSTAPDSLQIADPQLRALQVLRRRGLTARQAEVALLVATGVTTERIAQTLGISTGTVRKHLESVYLVLGAATRAQATASILRLVHPEAAAVLPGLVEST